MILYVVYGGGQWLLSFELRSQKCTMLDLFSTMQANGCTERVLLEQTRLEQALSLYSTVVQLLQIKLLCQVLLAVDFHRVK